MANVDMVDTDCWCGLPFSMPRRLFEGCRKTGRGFYCPMGHKIAFKETDADRLRRERDRLQQRLAERDDEIRHQRERVEQAQRSAAAVRGHVTRLKKRVVGGACPCCNRHFMNLQRHMKSKHPSYVDEPVDDGLKVIEGGKPA